MNGVGWDYVIQASFRMIAKRSTVYQVTGEFNTRT